MPDLNGEMPQTSIVVSRLMFGLWDPENEVGLCFNPQILDIIFTDRNQID